MPFRTRPISDLQRSEYHRGPSRGERESKTQFERLRLVMAYLREHGHGGCIVLPLPLSQLNIRRHYMETAKLKKQFAEYCGIIYNANLMPQMPRVIPSHATLRVQYFVHQKMDSDNLAACNKNILDWLKGKYIVDDSDKYLSVVMLEQIIDRTAPRVQIALNSQETSP